MRAGRVKIPFRCVPPSVSVAEYSLAWLAVSVCSSSVPPSVRQNGHLAIPERCLPLLQPPSFINNNFLLMPLHWHQWTYQVVVNFAKNQRSTRIVGPWSRPVIGWVNIERANQHYTSTLATLFQLSDQSKEIKEVLIKSCERFHTHANQIWCKQYINRMRK